ncbi:MAG TPA: ABC transporter ATP-binding protein [Acidobacteriaceae bacterium]|nr:ABC transporter ATP-binding protein [Acidobacteriaceae bacterium]
MSATAVLTPTATAWPAPLSQTRTIAKLHSVTKRYGQTIALENFSMELRAGEVVALLGPNGAGKTTAVRLLLGLIAANAGTVRVFGRDPRDADARTRIGAMLQVTRVPEMLRVREHIDLFRTYYPNPLPADEVIRIAKIESIADQMFGKLSGGQKQRTLFALALCGNPDLIFLDEPTVGMDIESRRALWDEVRALSAAGKTVLLTTHYLEEADMLAHRIVVINKGHVVCEGTPAEIKHRVSGRRIRCITQLDPEFLATLPSVADVQQDREAVVILAEHPEQVVREILLRDETLHGLEVSAAALEDAFLALTSNHEPAQA